MVDVQAACTLVTCIIGVGAVLIYVGKSLRTLQQIDVNQKVLFDRTEHHGKELARIDKDLVQVKTRQEDCDSCP